HDAEPDEGERAQHAIEAGKVEKEDLEHGRHDEARRGEARLAGTLPKPVAQKKDTEDEPGCRVGVKLTLREAFKKVHRLAMEDAAYLEAHIGEEEKDRRRDPEGGIAPRH